MKRTGLMLAFCLGSLFGYSEEPAPVTISTSTPEVWIGERARITVELRALGSFSGTAAFDLPELAGTLLMKTGNPVVSSREEGGKSWFIQTHDFSLFSQREGTLTIPSFPVRFAAKKGFTGDAKEVVSNAEPLTLTIKRPPGSEEIGFLVTSSDLNISQTWDPFVTKAKVGDVFRRTISQQSTGLTGIALQPAPRDEIPGVRIYEPQVETSDDLERGRFVGERRETLTYLLQDSGTLTLPEVAFSWWNPESEKLEQEILPGVTLTVSAPPKAPEVKKARRIWPTLILTFAIALSLVLFRSRWMAFFRSLWQKINPPSKSAARQLRRACRQNDPSAAEAAWTRWVRSTGTTEIPSFLEKEVTRLHRSIYGPGNDVAWTGSDLLVAFSRAVKALHSLRTKTSDFALPPLNGRNERESSHY